MELEGKYLVAWIPNEIVAVILGFDPGDTPVGAWTFAGRVHGESPMGVWLAVDTMVTPAEEELSQEDEPIYLLRWEWISRARLFVEPPAALPRVGFARD